MKETRGVADVIKVAVTSNHVQSVRVIDRGAQVELVLSANSYPARMTPEEAKFVAKCLVQSANRAEKVK